MKSYSNALIIWSILDAFESTHFVIQKRTILVLGEKVVREQHKLNPGTFDEMVNCIHPVTHPHLELTARQKPERRRRRVH